MSKLSVTEAADIIQGAKYLEENHADIIEAIKSNINLCDNSISRAINAMSALAEKLEGAEIDGF